ncbi:MAG: protein translocase subunit SecDF [Bacteroidales bacterium]|jgi:SecD/SecF fusion protein|nr:protein translocase subunit SecDF [Bacteroidales bacterium]
MRNRGTIIFVTIVLVLISLYYLSFTVVTTVVEHKAKNYAIEKVDNMKKELSEIQKNSLIDSIKKTYLDSVENIVVYPLIKKYTYMNCKERELNLGLDLKGGMNISLEISAEDVVYALVTNKNDSTLNKAMREARTKADKQTGANFIQTFATAYNTVKNPSSPTLASLFVTSSNKDRISIKSTDAEIVNYLTTEYKAAIGNAGDVLNKRIDQFGVVQPNIQKDVAVEGVFHIELPGIKDPERVETLLRQAAVLEFWETYETKEIANQLIAADQIITQQFLAENNLSAITAPKGNTNQDEIIEDKVISDEVIVDDSLATDTDTNTIAQDTINPQNNNILFQKLQPNFQNPDGSEVVGPIVGYAKAADRESIMKALNQPRIKALFPNDIEFAWTFKSDKNTGIYQLIALKKSKNTGGGVLSGNVVTNATQEFGQNRATAEVSMTMSGEGATQWARITAKNIKKSIAIVLDGFVYSFPTVQNEITGGRSSITGNFTLEEATDLANVLKSGKMPAPARILSKEVVGPSLGQKAINDGLGSFIIAFFLVMFYMWFYYNKAGLIANVALITNLFLIFGVLAAMGAVLTLPGIAGIVLTIGMAIDANVLIFERMKEEIRAGKNLKTAVADGYSNAYSAIIDSNITTMLIGVVLYFFGTGPVKGFATTLIIGILCSLFTAIFISKLIITALLNKNKKISLGTKFTINAFEKLNIDFLGKRKIAYVISGTMILISIISLCTLKLNPGIDFAGGRNYVVTLKEIASPESVSNELEKVYGDKPIVKIYGADNQLKITTKYKIDIDGTDQEADELLYEGMKNGGFISQDVTQDDFFANYRQTSQKVGPTVSQDITSKSIVAVLLALLGMFIYILFRFRKWQYSLSATIALMHDAIIVIGVFSLCYSFMPFSMEIDQAFIAAILTVIGYSINDTVVIFDRLREYIKIHITRDRKQIINSAINSTVNRTINTSLSTLIVVIAIFIFGGEVIRGFVFAMLIGIVVGTYSSIFIAAPLSYDFSRKSSKKDKINVEPKLVK